MAISVREKADIVATYRFVAVSLMETLARWVPTSPELEAKALFGRHIWDLAQIADQLGRRTAELRLAMHQSRTPRGAYIDALAALAATNATGDRLASFYDAALPDFARRIGVFLATADALLDDPTIRIAERALTELDRMRAQRDQLLGERADLRAHDPTALARMRGLLGSLDDFVEYRPAPAAEVA